MADGTWKRPFWMHQLAEYAVGAAMVVFGLRSPTPLLPTIVGLFVVIHAASTLGPLAAFRLVPRRIHRWIDVGLIAAALAAAAQPWIHVDGGTRVVLALAAVAHLVIWMNSSYADPAPKLRRAATSGDRAAAVGQMAGRMAGKGVRAWRDRGSR